MYEEQLALFAIYTVRQKWGEFWYLVTYCEFYNGYTQVLSSYRLTGG